ncbi:MAG TPA: DUF2785 domain-containing protein [Acidimicrobiales bacterium]|nr:DUF2785 domain-containing protein [Acidimicrobiales bacterium]
MPDLATADLLDLLTSADPHERDEVAYTELAGRITSGGEDGSLLVIGDRLVGYFEDGRVYARSFAALVLAEVVTRDAMIGALDPAAVHRWLAAFSDWYLEEQDLRGFDDDLGWLHAVAHGADAIGAFARHRLLRRGELGGLLRLARDRVLSSGATLFAAHEDDRVALAMALVLARPEVGGDESVRWLNALEGAFASGEPGPVPPWVSNTVHTLRALYVLVHEGGHVPGEPSRSFSVPDRDLVTGAIARTLRELFPFIG